MEDIAHHEAEGSSTKKKIIKIVLIDIILRAVEENTWVGWQDDV